MKGWLRHHVDSARSVARRLGRAPLGTALSVLAIGTALALPLAGHVAIDNLQRIARPASVDPEMSVFLEPETTQADVRRIESELEELVGKERFRFVPRDEALATLSGIEGLSDLVATLTRNPLPDAFVIRLDARGASGADALADRLAKVPKVARVQFDSAWATRLDAMLRLGQAALTVLGSLLGLALVAVTFDTVRSQIAIRRDEIEVSRLVGATEGFIRRPFLYLGAGLGFLGGLAALALVAGAVAFLAGDVERLGALWGIRAQLVPVSMGDAAAVVALSTLLGWLGGWLSVSRHLLSA